MSGILVRKENSLERPCPNLTHSLFLTCGLWDVFLQRHSLRAALACALFDTQVRRGGLWLHDLHWQQWTPSRACGGGDHSGNDRGGYVLQTSCLSFHYIRQILEGVWQSLHSVYGNRGMLFRTKLHKEKSLAVSKLAGLCLGFHNRKSEVIEPGFENYDYKKVL